MIKTADVVIIGGGVHGCSIAYHLASKGCKKVVICEKNYLASGATGRTGAGIRQQFGTEINCRLAKENVKAFERMQEELEYPDDLEFYQGGYLLPAYSEKQLAQFKKNVKLQREHGIKSQILSTEEVKEVTPYLNTEQVVGASYCSKDGYVNPFHVTRAYAMAAIKRGVNIYRYTEVIDIKTEKGKVSEVVTNRGKISTPVVVCAAGPWSKEIARFVGVDIPIKPQRRQALITEPVEHILDPLILCYHDGTYWRQTSHGGFLMGIGGENERDEITNESSKYFLNVVARNVIKHMPVLKNISVLRQWAGTYDLTPDGQAIIGPVEGVDGFYLDAGWSGHGFQFSPSIGRILAEMIMGETPFISVEALNLKRFATGQLIPEPVAAI